MSEPLRTCTSCGERSEALDGASLPAEREAALCELCRQRRRNREGRCPNCGGADLILEPEPNALTGRPLRDPVTREVRERERCPVSACGYTRRVRPPTRRRLRT